MRVFSCKKGVLSIYWKNPEGPGPRMLRVLSLPEKGAALHESSPGRCDRPGLEKAPRRGQRLPREQLRGRGRTWRGRCVHPAPPSPALPPGRSLGKLPAQRTGRGFPDDPSSEGPRGQQPPGEGVSAGWTQGPGAGGTGRPGGSPEPGWQRLLRSLVFNRM